MNSKKHRRKSSADILRKIQRDISKLKKKAKKNKKASKAPHKRQRIAPVFTQGVTDITLSTTRAQKGYTVKNPLTGHDITIRDWSNKNRVPWDIAHGAAKEITNGKKGRYCAALVKIMSRLLSKGYPLSLLQNASIIPQELVPLAITKSGLTFGVHDEPDMLGDPVETLTDETTVTSSGNERVRKIASFKNVIETLSIDMSKFPRISEDGKPLGYVEHLAMVRPDVIEVLKERQRAGGSFKAILTYYVSMSNDLKLDWRIKARSIKWNHEETLDNLIRDIDNGAAIPAYLDPGRQAHFRSNYEFTSPTIIRTSTDVDELTTLMYKVIEKQIEEYQNRASGFYFLQSKRMEITLTEYRPTNVQRLGDLVGRWVDTPKWLRNNNYGIWNPVTGPEGNCFAVCILRARYPKRDKSDLHSVAAPFSEWSDLEKHMEEVNLGKYSYPLRLKEKVFNDIERINPWFSFSVFALDSKRKMTAIYVSKMKGQRGRKLHVTLGLLTGLPPSCDDEYSKVSHFVKINNLATVLRGRGARRGNHNSTFVACENCLTLHKGGENEAGQSYLAAHEAVCMSQSPTKLILPLKGSDSEYLYFKQWRFRHVMPFTVYADFEALSQPLRQDCDMDWTHANRKDIAYQEPMGWAYKIVCHYAEHENVRGVYNQPLSKVRSYCGVNSMHEFFISILSDVEHMQGVLHAEERDYQSRPEDKEKRLKETHCCVCMRPLVETYNPFLERQENEQPDLVLDHDHYTGLYRGIAHTECNTHYHAKKSRIPVFFHNLKGYDGYHLLRGVQDAFDRVKKIGCIAKSMEKFSSLTINDSVSFVDTMEFQKGSLDSMVAGLRKNTPKEQWPTVFRIVLNHFKTIDDLDFLLRKGSYPYEYMDSYARLKDRSLPPIDKFGSIFDMPCLTEEDKNKKKKYYERAVKAWQLFGCETMEDYTRAYNELDVCIHASYFEAFFKASSEGFGLDARRFVSAPSLALSANLFRCYTRNPPVRIQNITDVNMYLMVESGVRGGTTQVMKNMLRANFPEMDKTNISGLRYDPSKEEIRIFYLDANNLYGCAMKMKLPIGEYRYVRGGTKIETSQSPKAKPSIKMQYHEFEQVQRETFNRCLAELDADISEESSKYAPTFEQFVAEQEDLERERLQNRDAAEEKAWEKEQQEIALWNTVDMDVLKKHILSLDVDGDTGYIFSVDLYYPEELHESHNDYPLAPTARKREPSPFTKGYGKKVGVKFSMNASSTPKLVLDFEPKLNYVVHYKLLQFYLKHGLEMRACHSVIAFQQEAWIAPHIEFCADARAKATSLAVKNFYKLLANAFFGKMLEDLRSHRNIDILLADQWNKVLHHISSPWMSSCRVIVDDAMVIMERLKHEVKLTRPIAVGMSILDLAKLIMFEFHYDIMLPHFGHTCLEMAYTDTDSLIYAVHGIPEETIWHSMARLQLKTHCFDLSGYPPDHPIFRETFEDGAKVEKGCKCCSKVLGKMKDELMGADMLEFVAVRAKAYSLVKIDIPRDKNEAPILAYDDWAGRVRHEKHVHKGIMNRAQIIVNDGTDKQWHEMPTKPIEHSDYLAVLGNKQAEVRFGRIVNNAAFELETVMERKKAFNSCDDKSYYLDEMYSLRYGHKDIPAKEEVYASLRPLVPCDACGDTVAKWGSDLCQECRFKEEIESTISRAREEKNIRSASSSSGDEEENGLLSPPNKKRRTKQKKVGTSIFFDEEAECSDEGEDKGSDGEDNDLHDSDIEFIDDSESG